MINEKASLVQIPSGYKSGTLYSVVPNTSSGDFTVTGDPQGEATRVNKDGLIESVAADVPRLNYDPANPQDPHLLLEPERTNIYTYSQDLNQGTTLTNTSVDNDNTTSPDGSLTGNKLTQTSGAYTRKTLTSLSGTYSWSFFAKKGDLRYLNARSLFVLNGTTPANGNTIIDLDTNTIAYKGTNVTSASIQQYPNDWIKVEIVATDNATGSGDFVDFFFTDSDTSTQSTGVAGNGFIWGVQFEAGSYPTSYIPTQGETNGVTRSAETCNNAGNSTVFNDSEGVLYAEIAALADDGTSRRISLSNGSTSNTVEILFQNTGTVSFQVKSGNSFQGGGAFNLTQTEFNKIAVKYKANDLALWVNGSERSTDTSANTPIGLSELAFDNGGGGSDFYGKTKEIRVYNTALTDSELITLTT